VDSPLEGFVKQVDFKLAVKEWDSHE